VEAQMEGLDLQALVGCPVDLPLLMFALFSLMLRLDRSDDLPLSYFFLECHKLDETDSAICA
jgi:hypothetical protein